MSTYPGQDGLRTPLKVARGNGASGTGVHHWWIQRVTAIALIPLSIWFLFLVGGLLHATYPEVLASIAQPVHAIFLIVLSVCLFWHGALGLQVIIEDYVHSDLKLTLIMLNTFFCFAVGISCVYAIVKLSYGV